MHDLAMEISLKVPKRLCCVGKLENQRFRNFAFTKGTAKPGAGRLGAFLVLSRMLGIYSLDNGCVMEDFCCDIFGQI